MPLESPVVINGSIIGAYNNKFKVAGVGLVSLEELLQYAINTAEGGGVSGGDKIYIDADWVIKGSDGIVAGVALPGTNVITVPEGKSLSSLQTRIIDPLTELDIDGNMRVNINWNTSDYNQGIITAFTPVVFFLDSDGNQFTAGELGITVRNAAASGLTNTELIIQGSLDTPFSVKLLF